MLNQASKAAVAVVFALSASYTPSILAQASGQTNVTVSFPNVIILHYPANLTLNLTPATGGDSARVEADITASAPFASSIVVDGGLTPTADPNDPLTADPLVLSIVARQVWAVRGITNTGTITVTGTIDSADATSGSASTATLNDLSVGAPGVTGAGSIQVNAPGFALNNAVIGNVVLELDVSNVTTAGAHTGIQYTIEASAP